jgi:hypothetical protein
MRFWLRDLLGDFGRRRRARQAAAQFEDPALRAAAERVFFFVDRVAGVRPSELDVDAPLGPLIAKTNNQEVWDQLEVVIGQGDVRRLHLVENARSGTVRHLMNHLCICRVCRKQ